jgi:hypothetical protein
MPICGDRSTIARYWRSSPKDLARAILLQTGHRHGPRLWQALPGSRRSLGRSMGGAARLTPKKISTGSMSTWHKPKHPGGRLSACRLVPSGPHLADALTNLQHVIPLDPSSADPVEMAYWLVVADAWRRAGAISTPRCRWIPAPYQSAMSRNSVRYRKPNSGWHPREILSRLP